MFTGLKPVVKKFIIDLQAMPVAYQLRYTS
jgi:hypothetical protein